MTITKRAQEEPILRQRVSITFPAIELSRSPTSGWLLLLSCLAFSFLAHAQVSINYVVDPSTLVHQSLWLAILVSSVMRHVLRGTII